MSTASRRKLARRDFAAIVHGMTPKQRAAFRRWRTRLWLVVDRVQDDVRAMSLTDDPGIRDHRFECAVENLDEFFDLLENVSVATQESHPCPA